VAQINKMINATGILESECDMLVNQYAGQIIQYILQGLQPDQVCSAISTHCPSPVFFFLPLFFVLFFPFPWVADVALYTRLDLCPGGSCQLCKVLVSTIDAILGTDPSEQEIIALLKYICTVRTTPLFF
jgi:hypothetical protein